MSGCVKCDGLEGAYRAVSKANIAMADEIRRLQRYLKFTVAARDQAVQFTRHFSDCDCPSECAPIKRAYAAGLAHAVKRLREMAEKLVLAEKMDAHRLLHDMADHVAGEKGKGK